MCTGFLWRDEEEEEKKGEEADGLLIRCNILLCKFQNNVLGYFYMRSRFSTSR